MSDTILIVEEDQELSNMLQIYFKGKEYTVHAASNGRTALEMAKNDLPQLVLLAVDLPDIDGYEVCSRLRSNTRSSRIPIFFLTQRTDRADKLRGFEVGADDYITKPFDIEELNLRVQNALKRAEYESLTDPRSRLPAGPLIEEELRGIIGKSGWAYMDVRINNFEAFNEVYGYVAADDLMRFTTMVIKEAVEEFGTPDDFIGHPGANNFIIITNEANADAIKEAIKQRFGEQVLSHYNFTDRQRGYILTTNDVGSQSQAPLMRIAIGAISPTTRPIADIRELTELAVEARRQDSLSNNT